MDKKKLTIESGSFNEEGSIRITIEGKSEIFGGNDLLFKSILSLIQSLDFKFQEENDPNISSKYYLSIMDILGVMIKEDSYLDDEMPNLHSVKYFIETALENKWDENPKFTKYFVKDEEL